MREATLLFAATSALVAALGAVAILLGGMSLGARAYTRWHAASAVITAFLMPLLVSPVPRSRVLGLLAGLVAALVYACGFRLRATRRGPSPASITVAGALLLALAAMLFWGLLPAPVAKSLLLLLIGGALAWALPAIVVDAWEVTPSERAIWLLLGFVAAVAVSVAVAELLHGGGDRDLLSVAAAPLLVGTVALTAMMALLTLLLLASDFARRRRRLVHTDALTGVLNRAGIDHVVQRLARRRPITVAIADIDRFKAINDRHGHGVGDAVLARFARGIAVALGRAEAVGRIGGEEFLLLLADRVDAAHERVERLRAAIAQTTLDERPELGFTASFGVAEWRRGEPIEDVIARADAALYRAKHDGRDRVVRAEAA